MAATREQVPVSNILDYGAVPDPINGPVPPNIDNSDAIQRAIYAARIHGSGTIFVPPGNFTCRKPLVFDYTSGLRFVGAAKARQFAVPGSGVYLCPSTIHFRKPHRVFWPPFLIGVRSVQGMTIQDLGFRADDSFNRVLIDFDVGTCMGDVESRDINIVDCWFTQNSSRANFLRLGNGTSRVSVVRNHFVNGETGILSDGAREVTVRECGFGFRGPHTPIRLRARSDNWTITFCGFEPSGSDPEQNDNFSRAIWCVRDDGSPIPPESACRGMVITYNWIGDDNLIPCDVIRVVARGLHVVGNFFFGQTIRTAIVLHEGSRGAFIAGNRFTSNGELVVRVDENVGGVAIVANNTAGYPIVCVPDQGPRQPVVVIGNHNHINYRSSI